jgi:hypothetical protein
VKEKVYQELQIKKINIGKLLVNFADKDGNHLDDPNYQEER